MPTHHTLECAKSRLNPEILGWLNGSFLLTESLVKSICEEAACLRTYALG